MPRFPTPKRRDYAAGAGATLALAVGYGVVGTPLAQYTAWLVVFCVWMVWFVLVAVEVVRVIDR
ncbi:hypothetical protein [Halorarius halobius]|uniref:hypothetical protein n=1 Tax=Halorarius halobius TaxID=2962671 RepID=UPI0020CE5162|nr:hypothetical protein [Halorarius halobius]